MVSSFNHYELQKFKKFCPEIRIGALISGIPIGYADFALPLDAYSVNLDCDFCTQAFVDDAHKKGFKVLVWTVNDLENIERFKEMGVDGVFSNFPDLK
jgi:glycerophosphoryl diester phosphodiesterase